MNARDETHLLSGAYALHALSPEEAARVEAAMAESEELRGEVVGLADTAVELGTAVPSAVPPPALRAALLAAIADLPQEPREDEPLPPVDVPSGAHVAPRRRRRSRRPALLVGLVAVAALLFGGGVLVEQAVNGPQVAFSAISTAADAQHAVKEVAGGGTATVYWSSARNGTAVALTGVRVPSGRALQLWRIEGGRAVSEGVYGSGEPFRVLDGVPPKTGEQLAVTVEPAGGSAQPTTPAIVQLPLAA